MELLILKEPVTTKNPQEDLNSNMELLIWFISANPLLLSIWFKFQYGATNICFQFLLCLISSIFKFQYGATNIPLLSYPKAKTPVI